MARGTTYGKNSIGHPCSEAQERKPLAYPLLQVLSNVVIKLKLIPDIFQLVIVHFGIFTGRYGRGEEVEERRGLLRLAHDTRAVGV